MTTRPGERAGAIVRWCVVGAAIGLLPVIPVLHAQPTQHAQHAQHADDAQPSLASAAPAHISRALHAVTAARVSDSTSRDAGDAWHLDRCLLGVSYGAPLKLHAGIGGGLRRAGASRTACVYGAAQLGLGGTRTSLGAATTLGRYGSGIGVSMGVLRTFARPLGAEPWSNYAGGSLHLWPVLGLHTEIGWYRALGSAMDGGDHMFAWSVGFGM